MRSPPLVPPLRIWRRIWDSHYLIDHRQPVLTEEAGASYVKAIIYRRAIVWMRIVALTGIRRDGGKTHVRPLMPCT